MNNNTSIAQTTVQATTGRAIDFGADRSAELLRSIGYPNPTVPGPDRMARFEPGFPGLRHVTVNRRLCDR